MVVSLKTDLRFPIPGQQGYGDRIIQCMQIFQNAGIHPSILRTARVESLISAVAVNEGISLFAESNFRLFQHEGVVSVPLEESPVLRIGFAYKKAGEHTPAMDCFLRFMANAQNMQQ